MNARDELFSYICAHRGISDLEANDLIDAYAHELAERGRKFAGPRQMGDEVEFVVQYAGGWHDALDYIDPEV